MSPPRESRPLGKRAADVSTGRGVDETRVAPVEVAPSGDMVDRYRQRHDNARRHAQTLADDERALLLDASVPLDPEPVMLRDEVARLVVELVAASPPSTELRTARAALDRVYVGGAAVRLRDKEIRRYRRLVNRSRDSAPNSEVAS